MPKWAEMGMTAGGALDDRHSPACALHGAVALVIDDSPANVLLLERLLTRSGVERVEGVTDPRQATEALRRVDPDIVLLDLHMPHIDGMALLEAFRTVIPHDSFLPLIVLTADTTPEAKNQALAAGANDFLTKPFEHDEVLLRVNNLLRTRRLHNELRRHNQQLQAEIKRKEAIERRQAEDRSERRSRIQRILEGRGLTMVFQPIVDLRSNRVAGFEALARFSEEPLRPPNEWFTEAAEFGLGVELELCAIRSAIAELDRLPADAYLSVNASPETVLHRDLTGTVEAHAGRIVLELTEHTAVTEYGTLIERVDVVRGLGVRIAVDDAGAGYASLQHILRLCPDIVKLDVALTRSVDSDPARRALATALVQFGREIGADITAEGIERQEELDALRNIGACSGQGYLLGRPAPLPSAN